MNILLGIKIRTSMMPGFYDSQRTYDLCPK